ncbi:MAG: zf-HC2 domain-containing protein [Acidobacteria bacterium]|nr:zf-HC2 domain-containing protein [Acidobacteriota bacterium]
MKDPSYNLEPGVRARMVRYLLGDLEETEKSGLERQLLSDPAFYDTFSAVEAELVDAYVSGELTPEERSRFERHFLQSARHRELLENSRALREALHSGRERRASMVWYGVAAAVLVLLGLAGTAGWRLVHRIDRLERELVEERTRRVAAPPVAVSFVLSSAASRGPGAGHWLVVPALASEVRLEIELQNTARYARYRASVETAEGGEIWSQILAGDRSLTLVLPARIVDPGDYILGLQGLAGGGPPVKTASYTFRTSVR